MSRRLIHRIVIPLVLAFAGFVLPLTLVTIHDARRGLVELAERQAASMALVAGGLDRVDDAVRIHASLPGARGVPGERLAVLSWNGEVLAATDSGPLTFDDEVVAAAMRGFLTGSFDASLGVVTAGAPISPGDDVDAVAVVTLPTAALQARIRLALGVLGAASAGLILVAGVAGRNFASSIVRPVERIDEVARQLAGGDLSARAPVPDEPPELRSLAETLNATAAQLQDRVERESAFAAMASHQLRTPLTGLRLRLENLQLAGAPQRQVEAAIAEADRLAAIVEQLLALARAQGQALEYEVVDAAEVARERCAVWGPAAAAHDVAIHVDASLDDARVMAVPGALDHILDNYLSNALRVAPAGSAVDVSVTGDGEGLVVRVRDRGPGMDAEALGRAFDRYWRAPQGVKDGGSGLGLAIVAELARASGGTASLHPAPGGGLVAQIQLLRAGADGNDRPFPKAAHDAGG